MIIQALDKVRHFYINKYLVTPFASKKYFIAYDSTHKALLYRVGKVANTSIINVMSESDRYICGSEMAYTPSTLQNYFKFAFVRNPIDRFISAWTDKVVDNNHFKFDADMYVEMQSIDNFISFAEGVDLVKGDVHLRLQCELIDMDYVDYIGRFENIKEDFNYVANMIGLTGRLPHMNKSSNQNRLLGMDSVNRLHKLYAQDFEAFKY